MKIRKIYCGLFLQIAVAQRCSSSLCAVCCTPTSLGCINNNFSQERNSIATDITLCQDCQCSNPAIGCGWAVPKGVQMLQCDACSYLNRKFPKSVINGCGSFANNGRIFRVGLDWSAS